MCDSDWSAADCRFAANRKCIRKGNRDLWDDRRGWSQIVRVRGLFKYDFWRKEDCGVSVIAITTYCG
jgi:hypothetical protein